MRRLLPALLLAGLAGTLAACRAPAGSAPPPPSSPPSPTSGTPRMKLELHLPKDRFLVSEEIALSVAVTNDGPAAVAIPDPFRSMNWQPAYTLHGPGRGPDGQAFSFRSVTTGDRRAAPDDVPPVLLRLAPGETAVDEVPLHQWLEDLVPGSYRLSARLAWEGIAAEAAAIAFEIEPADLASVSLGVDDRVPNRLGEWADWIHHGPGGPRLFTAVFREPIIDQHGFRTFTVMDLRSAPAGATDVLTPWANYNRQAGLTRWRAWREEGALVAQPNHLADPVRLDLGGIPAAVVRPALMTADGTLDVFFLATGARELVLARFPGARGRPAGAPLLVGRAPVPAGVTGLRAALAPTGDQADRHVVLTWDEGGAFHVGHLVWSAAGEPGLMAVSRFADTRSLPQSQPALRVEADGTALASVLCLTGASRRAAGLGVVDLRVPPGDAASPEAALADLGPLEHAPRAAAASFVTTAGAVPRRDWVVLFDDRRAVNSRSTPALQRLPAEPVRPLELLSLADAAYLVTADPDAGLQFVTMF